MCLCVAALWSTAGGSWPRLTVRRKSQDGEKVTDLPQCDESFHGFLLQDLNQIFFTCRKMHAYLGTHPHLKTKLPAEEITRQEVFSPHHDIMLVQLKNPATYPTVKLPKCLPCPKCLQRPRKWVKNHSVYFFLLLWWHIFIWTRAQATTKNIAH